MSGRPPGSYISTALCSKKRNHRVFPSLFLRLATADHRIRAETLVIRVPDNVAHSPEWRFLGQMDCSTHRRYRGSIRRRPLLIVGRYATGCTRQGYLDQPAKCRRCHRAAGHSWRSARIGSTLVARSAGIRLASTATTIRNSAAPAMLTGSAGLTW